MIDREAFFSAIRGPIFGGTMTQPQVDGVIAILDEADSRPTLTRRELAYLLATPCIETGMRFQPITESLNYSSGALRSKFPSRITAAEADRFGRTKSHAANQEAIGNIIYGGEWGARNLGNTQPGDGYRYRGRGIAQTTGRVNYVKASAATGVDLVKDPERAAELRLSVVVMFDAMLNGWFTGKKLSDYLAGPMPDFVNARRTINGTDKANDIAAYAQKFLTAINAASRPSVGPTEPVRPPPDFEPPLPRPAPSLPSTTPAEAGTAAGAFALVMAGIATGVKWLFIIAAVVAVAYVGFRIWARWGKK
jgi:putative chitinase